MVDLVLLFLIFGAIMGFLLMRDREKVTLTAWILGFVSTFIVCYIIAWLLGVLVGASAVEPQAAFTSTILGFIVGALPAYVYEKLKTV